MKKKYAYLILILITSTYISAQNSTVQKPQLKADSIKHWTFSGKNNITFGSVSMTNWAPGGEEALSGVSSIDYELNYSKSPHKWENRLILRYGRAKQGVRQSVKTDDQIDISTIYGYKAKGHWYYSMGAGFRTQFEDGFKINEKGDTLFSSSYMAPGYLMISPGIVYIPNNNFKIAISPAASRFTYVYNSFLSSVGAYGVEPGENIRYEFGTYVNIDWEHYFNQHFSMEHILRLYSNYLKNPENIDVAWVGKFSVKVLRFIGIHYTAQILYDDDINVITSTGTGPRVQFKGSLGVGIRYDF
ncbi:MAG: DUF3078 domain-containing protein [Ichthyobacteriaceae bacterium]|nr:DUF3078 domain-containing protein [Ichthyobacteriaceae bacterium]